MANALPPGLQKKLNQAVDEHQAAVSKGDAKPSATATASPIAPKNTLQIITTQPPQISAQELETAHQTAVAETLVAHKVPDKQLFSILGGRVQYHQLSSQYLLTFQPGLLSFLAIILWVTFCIALLAGASWLLMLPKRQKQKPATQVKRLSLFAP